MQYPDNIARHRAAVTTGRPSQLLRGLALLCAGVSVMLVLGAQGQGAARMNGAGSPLLLGSGEAGVCVPKAVALAERQQRMRQWQRALVAMQPTILPLGMVLSVSEPLGSGKVVR